MNPVDGGQAPESPDPPMANGLNLPSADSPAKKSRPAVRRSAASKGELWQSGLLADIIGHDVALADARLRRPFHDRKLNLVLRPAEFSLLALAQANPGINQRQLGLALGIAAPNMAVLTERLEDRGLVLRERSQVDRRAQRISITPAGAEALQATHQHLVACEEKALRQLSPADRRTLVALLRRIA